MNRLFVLAVDGLDWQLLNEFMEKGLLPNFQRLVVKSAWGALDLSGEVIRSPVLWTSMASGKRSDKHGITDFVDRNGVPVTSNMVRTKRVWEILSEQGYSCGVIGWLVTYPPDEIRGFMISDRYNEKDGYCPPEIEELMPNVNLKKKTQEFSSFSFDSLYRLKYKENSMQWVRNHLYKSRFLYVFHRDEKLRQWALRLLEEFDLHFMALYLQGIDYTCHAFWRYMRPWEFGGVKELGYSDVSQEDIEYFGRIIEKYYVHIDGVVEDLLKRLPEDWGLMVVSDHGFERISEKRIVDRGPLAGRFLSGDHRPESVLIVGGKGIKPGRVEEISIFDITPTVLHLFGLPIGRDLDGRVLEEILADRGSVQYVDTYEEGMRGEDRAIRTDANEEILERLRGLGYLER